MASVDPTIASTIAAATTIKMSRDSLHTACANKSQTRIFNLPEAQPVANYIHAVRTLSDELAIARASVANDELIVKILNGLRPEFHEISTDIHARDSTITYEELYEKLLDQELFLKHEESKKDNLPITVAAAAKVDPTTLTTATIADPTIATHLGNPPTVPICHLSGIPLLPTPPLNQFAANNATN
ncbi:hypothetical protein ACH5RR_022726 [Cinchona calisaya]|uniref:Uncharacterized protein n=1 Tax=Cinchona calisaya TaxID=153742 RepID=A0ABD2Z9Q6_9GENT